MVSVRLAECFVGKKTSIWSFLVLDLARNDGDQTLKSSKNLDVQIWREVRHFRVPNFWILEISSLCHRNFGKKTWNPAVTYDGDVWRKTFVVFFGKFTVATGVFHSFFFFNRNSDGFMKQITIGGSRRQYCWHLHWFLHIVILRNRSLPKTLVNEMRKLSIIKVGLSQLVPNSLRCECF